MSAPPSWLPPLSDLDHALVNHLLYNGNMPMGNPMDDTPDETLLTQVMNLIRQGANPNLVKPAQNWQPAQTPLQLIAALHHRPTVRRVSAFLLEAGANPNPPEGTDLSPVVQAVQANDWLLVRTLVHHGARLDHLVYGQSLLLWAVNDDNPRMVTWMTRHGATLNEDERPLLVQRPAALVGRQGPALIAALVRASARVQPSQADVAPLVAVAEASGGSTAVPAQVVPAVQRLLDLGADPCRTQAYKVTWRRSHEPYGDVERSWENQGVSALHWAAWYGNTDLVAVLLNAGADPLARTRHRASPSTMKAWSAGAKDLPTVPEPDGGASALDWARDAGHLPVVALLERAQLQHAFQSQDTALSAGPASRVRL